MTDSAVAPVESVFAASRANAETIANDLVGHFPALLDCLLHNVRALPGCQAVQLPPDRSSLVTLGPLVLGLVAQQRSQARFVESIPVNPAHMPPGVNVGPEQDPLVVARTMVLLGLFFGEVLRAQFDQLEWQIGKVAYKAAGAPRTSYALSLTGFPHNVGLAPLDNIGHVVGGATLKVDKRHAHIVTYNAGLLVYEYDLWVAIASGRAFEPGSNVGVFTTRGRVT